MIELTDEQRQEFASAGYDDESRLMYPLLADLDPEDWEDAAIYEDKP